MKTHLLIISIFSITTLLGQNDVEPDSTAAVSIGSILKLCETLQQADTFELKYNKIRKFERIENLDKDSINDGQSDYLQEWRKTLKHYLESKTVSDFIYKLEADNYDRQQLSNETYKVLESYTSLKALSALLSIVQGQSFVHDTHKQFVQKKLIHTISVQMQTIAENTLPLYNYPTIEKKWFKGFQIEHANDLLHFGMFQKNNDMDYTGGLKFSIITDLLKLDLFNPTQSYQLITYGGEVYTPYFKDTSLFKTADATNPLDRPHGSFQFIGLENHAIGKYYKSRRTSNIRLGIIGSPFGYNFQFYLHRDLSVSPAPIGWDAQIGFPGRLALQGNYKYERLLDGKQADPAKSNRLRIVPSFSIEAAAGHFMTYLESGFNLSTHNFREKNQINIVSKAYTTKRTQVIKKAVFYADLNITVRGVIHNAMLDGFGLFVTGEENPLAFAKKSKYFLPRSRVRPLVLFTNLSFGWQLSKFNVFYKYSIKSPEYNSSGLLDAVNKKGENISPTAYWHHYGSLGISFTL